jgi:hypothetical protein
VGCLERGRKDTARRRRSSAVPLLDTPGRILRLNWGDAATRIWSAQIRSGDTPGILPGGGGTSRQGIAEEAMPPPRTPKKPRHPGRPKKAPPQSGAAPTHPPLWGEIRRHVPKSRREYFERRFLERTRDLHELDAIFSTNVNLQTELAAVLRVLPSYALLRFDLLADRGTGLAFPIRLGPTPDPVYEEYLGSARAKTFQNASNLLASVPEIPSDVREDLLSRLDLDLIAAVSKWLGKASELLLNYLSPANADVPPPPPLAARPLSRRRLLRTTGHPRVRNRVYLRSPLVISLAGTSNA